MSVIGTFGLGGGPSRMIINRFNLGGWGADIIIEPPRSGGGVGVSKRWRKDRPDVIYQDVTFRIRYHDKVWSKKYAWSSELVDAYVRVTGVVSKIVNRIKIFVEGVSKSITSFRLKR